MKQSTQILKNTNAQILDEFNASIMFDKELYSQDIKGSIAHSKMLALQNIITNDEQLEIEKGLLQVLKEIEKGEFKFSLEFEDIHMAVESRLIEIIGDSGKRVHTARSRNDQVCTDFTLYVQEKTVSIKKQIKTLIETFVELANKHTDTLMPGMTHLQHAQPISFGFHMMAYANMFKRDFERFKSSYERNNFSPLGSAALAGTPHNIDRFKTAELLGFTAPTQNAMDSVSNRDFALEILFNISTCMMHISRISEELILWSSYEFGFVKMSDMYATTSSIMPQKKNPDVPELLRGKTGRVYGNLISLLTVMKSLPLAYNKDTQEDKEGVFDSVSTIEISLSILNEVIKTMIINKEKMIEACKVGHLTATDLADYLVSKQNIPFRTAYYITKEVVAFANALNKDISELNIDEIRKSSKDLENVNEDIVSYLNLENSMNSRNSFGGTSTKQTKLAIETFQDWLKNI
ncbi:Argininosuccinate lyase 1 [Aliarcobacter thereius]|uniref:Argininosuccinate lyase n=2 Tax=Aliarcobacter thereius TaxID=544718 RepID=A0A1C0B6G3_9BACT|nr:argininosuccinate lyase [Aliarcobacter thereius]OCL86729.1 Argininosuccinate lyase 1 [Aliarcobacter thereius]OCL90931.1 Argininosuccinate lyase 1 [Aliarcobacter thereius]OCL96240.1 Argininosuccinate lyase 1 [Aliarcobacter thereius LMG 24486]OCL98898.1 Argininosuccinate lyase 1 [Aliarcobacter thereius]QBF15795.1 argininosuccinate lyase [Aliarcobacter thereius LMG 24486]